MYVEPLTTIEIKRAVGKQPHLTNQVDIELNTIQPPLNVARTLAIV